MSAGILKALMQLFAIIARGSDSGDNGSDSGKEIVAIFLSQQLNKELVQKYLAVYDEYREKNAENNTQETDRSKKRTSLFKPRTQFFHF